MQRKPTQNTTQKGKKRAKPKPIVAVSEEIRQRKNAYVAHILREHDEAPTRQCTFLPNSALPNLGILKRVGRPRKNWIETAMQEIWEVLRLKIQDEDTTQELDEIFNKQYDPKNILMSQQINTAAHLRFI